jgi:hypothetical protein
MREYHGKLGIFFVCDLTCRVYASHASVMRFVLTSNSARYDGLFISNGPGDPAMCEETVANLRWALDQVSWLLQTVCWMCAGDKAAVERNFLAEFDMERCSTVSCAQVCVRTNSRVYVSMMCKQNRVSVQQKQMYAYRNDVPGHPYLRYLPWKPAFGEGRGLQDLQAQVRKQRTQPACQGYAH